jgi:predicted metal-dependent hydrolase
MDDLIERFCAGIDKFNEGSFYECHDILEDVWFEIRGPSRRFYQGLIHLAVGFHHILERNNVKGALSQLSKGIEKLSEYKSVFQGVDVETLISQIQESITALVEIRAGRSNYFDPALVPGINFDRKMFDIGQR